MKAADVELQLSADDLDSICDAIEYTLDHEGAEDERRLHRLYDRLNDLIRDRYRGS